MRDTSPIENGCMKLQSPQFIGVATASILSMLAFALPTLAAPEELAGYVTAAFDENIGRITVKLGESFRTPNDGISYYLTSAKFRLKKTGSPTGTVSAKLYAHQGTFGDTSTPTGAALAVSTNTFGSSDVTTSFLEYEWLFDGTYQMAVNTEYVITIESSSDDLDNYFVSATTHSDLSGSPSGNSSYYQAGPWGSNDWDLHYAVWGDENDPNAPPPTQSTSSTPQLEIAMIRTTLDWALILAVFSVAAATGYKLFIGRTRI